MVIRPAMGAADEIPNQGLEPSLSRAQLDLEWQVIAQAVVGRCVGPRAERAFLPLAADLSEMRQANTETAEAMALLEAADPLPLSSGTDTQPLLRRVARESDLTAFELTSVLRMLEAAGRLRRFLNSKRETAPQLQAACATDPGLDVLADELSGALDPDGTLADHASAELRRLRTEVRNLHSRIVRRLEELIQQKGELLSDKFYTQREGRFVVPVRADTHERVPGIVHGASSSGQTIFVEPRSVVAQGNRLKMATLEMEREENRVLRVLTSSVGEYLPAAEFAAEALMHADLRNAGAKFGRDFQGRLPTLVAEPRLSLRGARHPTLAIEGVSVVPNDLQLASGNALILSGPNAGGKTVALKVMGLAALMGRAGVPLLTDEGSELGFFGPVLTDIGDQQSIEMNLSTFSAHITNLVSILDAAEPGALVLLDEVAGGTDPEEGAALASAIVEVLCERGAAVAVTSHYQSLKARGISDDRFHNASVGLDEKGLAPTFSVTLDLPGASSAFLVATRFGLPPRVIELAKLALPEQATQFSSLLGALRAQQEGLRAEQETVRALRFDLAAAHEGADVAHKKALEELSRAKLRGDQEIREANAKVLELLRQARVMARDAKTKLRKAEKREDLAAAESLAREADRIVTEVKPDVPDEPEEKKERKGVPLESVTLSDLNPGVVCYAPKLSREVTVVSVVSAKQIRVLAGPLKLTVSLSELAKAAPPAVSKAKSGRQTAAPTGPLIRTSDNTVDVRGLRVDEALGMLDVFVDRLFGQGAAGLFVLHGLGTGALRAAVREHLEADQHYVTGYAPADRNDGGDGVTVVRLK